jgi:hypothetical protein
LSPLLFFLLPSPSLLLIPPTISSILAVRTPRFYAPPIAHSPASPPATGRDDPRAGRPSVRPSAAVLPWGWGGALLRWLCFPFSFPPFRSHFPGIEPEIVTLFGVCALFQTSGSSAVVILSSWLWYWCFRVFFFCFCFCQIKSMASPDMSSASARHRCLKNLSWPPRRTRLLRWGCNSY